MLSQIISIQNFYIEFFTKMHPLQAVALIIEEVQKVIRGSNRAELNASIF